MQEMVVVQKIMLETPQKQGMLMASLENSTTLPKFLATAMRKVHNNVTKKWHDSPNLAKRLQIIGLTPVERMQSVALAVRCDSDSECVGGTYNVMLVTR